MANDKLALWQERLGKNDSQYESERAQMDVRQALYQGSRRIMPLVGTARAENSDTPHVRNICSEMIESQVNSSLPAPKVTAVRPEDEPLAKIIEDMLRNEMDRLPFEQLNDMMERTVPIQGGAAYLVEWDNTERTHNTVGELTVSPIHPKQIVPQAGVYTGIEDMDYIILKMPQTREYIRRRYGVDVSAEGETEPDIKSTSEADTAEDMVTQYIAYYRNDSGGIGLYSWVGNTELEDLEDYQARRLRRCAVCGALEPMEDVQDSRRGGRRLDVWSGPSTGRRGVARREHELAGGRAVRRAAGRRGQEHGQDMPLLRSGRVGGEHRGLRRHLLPYQAQRRQRHPRGAAGDRADRRA